MNHVQSLVAAPHFTVAPHPGSPGQLVFLRGAKMKESQRDASRAVRDDNDQGGAPAANNRRMLDFSFDQGPGAGIEGADGVNPRAVFISQG